MDRQELVNILKKNPELVAQYDVACLYNHDWIELIVNSSDPCLILRTALNVSYSVVSLRYIAKEAVAQKPSLQQYTNLIGISGYSISKHICSKDYKDSDIYDSRAIDEDDWAEILIVRPELAPKCPWYNFWASDFDYLLKKAPSFNNVIAWENDCGSLKRNIYVCIYDIQHVRIGCFYGTKEEAIEAIEHKYKHTSLRSIYIDKVKQVFKKAEELANVKNI